MNDREEEERQERIRQRAYRLWEQEGHPEGRADVHWDQATELVAIEENHRYATEPIPSPEDFGPSGEPIEPVEAAENVGEFPTMTDQGEQTYPPHRTQAGGGEANAAASKQRPVAKQRTVAAGSTKA